MVLQRFRVLLMIWVDFRPPSCGDGHRASRLPARRRPEPVHLKFEARSRRPFRKGRSWSLGVSGSMPTRGVGHSYLDSEDFMPTYDQIFEKVQATLVDALGVDEDEVTRNA